MKSQLQEAHEAIREFALRLPGAVEDHPWGETVAKVNKKIFVFYSNQEKDNFELRFSLKLPESHPIALKNKYAQPTGYGLGKSGWVTFQLPKGATLDLPQAIAWVEESYRAVAPKKLIKELDDLG